MWLVGCRSDLPSVLAIPQHDQFVDNKERAKDCFVVAGQPVGEVDIEIVYSLVGELGRQTCQGTPAAIQSECATLEEDDGAQDQNPIEPMHKSGDRQGQNASDQECPDCCVQKLDRSKHDAVRVLRPEFELCFRTLSICVGGWSQLFMVKSSSL